MLSRALIFVVIGYSVNLYAADSALKEKLEFFEKQTKEALQKLEDESKYDRAMRLKLRPLIWVTGPATPENVADSIEFEFIDDETARFLKRTEPTSEYEQYNAACEQRLKKQRAEYNRLASRLSQIKQYAGKPEVVINMRDAWDPKVIPVGDRLKLKISFEFVDMPFSEALDFIKEAIGCRTNFGPPGLPDESPKVGHWLFVGGLAGSIALVLLVIVRAFMKRQRLRYSIRWLLVLSVCVGIAMHGYIRRQEVEEAWEDYHASKSTYEKFREVPINLRVTDMDAELAVEWTCKLAEVDYAFDRERAKIKIVNATTQ